MATPADLRRMATPDAVYLLEVPEELRLARLGGRGVQLTAEERRLVRDDRFRERVLAGYRALGAISIDASGTPEEDSTDRAPARGREPAGHTGRWEPPVVMRSSHVRRRCQQRAIREAALDATLDWGVLYRQRRGRRVYYLGRRAVAVAAARGVNVRAYEGTAVIVAKDGVMVTAIRCQNPRRLRRRRAPRRGRG